MNDQDRRAVETLCQCGMDFETICSMFQKFSSVEIKGVYDNVHNLNVDRFEEPVLSRNCS